MRLNPKHLIGPPDIDGSAIVQFCKDGQLIQAFHLHWYGGPQSIHTFLSVLEQDYACGADAAPPRFAQLVGNYLGGCLSLYPCANGTLQRQGYGVYQVDTGQIPWRVKRIVRTLRVQAVHERDDIGELRKHIRQRNDRFFLPLGL